MYTYPCPTNPFHIFILSLFLLSKLNMFIETFHNCYFLYLFMLYKFLLFSHACPTMGWLRHLLTALVEAHPFSFM